MDNAPDKEVNNLLNSANLAYKDGDFAAAKAIAQRALTMDPENEATLRLLAMIKLAGNRQRNRILRQDEDSEVFGSTDRYGLGTYVATKSNQPVERPVDQLAPWEGGVDPLQNKSARKNKSEQQPMPQQPVYDAYAEPVEQQPASRRRKAQQEYPHIVDNTTGDEGNGVPMPMWINEPTGQVSYDDNNLDNDNTANTTQPRKSKSGRKAPALTPRVDSFGAKLNRILNIFQITPFRLICWACMFLFFITCIATCYVKFNTKPTQPTLSPQAISNLEQLLKDKRYDDMLRKLGSELKDVKQPEKDPKANPYYVKAYIGIGTITLSTNTDNNIDNAIMYYKKALDCNQDNPQSCLYLANAMYHKGKQLKKDGKNNEAKTIFVEATKLLDKSLNLEVTKDAYTLGASLADETNQPERAKDYRERAQKFLQGNTAKKK